MASKAGSSEDMIQMVRGHPFPNASFYPRKSIEEAMDYVPKDGDVIITSYPKTGTTWMQYIVMQIVSKATIFSTFDDAIFKLYPYIEMVGAAAVDALKDPRIYKHHIPYNMVQKNEKSKLLYTYRHPEDVIASFYHFHLSLYHAHRFNFNEFVELFLTGSIGFGGYFTHIMSFYEHRDDPNLLMVSYEKLHANRRDEILRIAKFLGEEHHACLVEQEDILDKVMEHTSFAYMRKNLYLSHPDKEKDGQPLENINFFRKGIVGDGRNVLTEQQRERLKECAKKILKGSSILEEWYPEEI